MIARRLAAQALHDDEWNAALRDALPAALLGAARRERWLRERLGSWLPRPHECIDAWWRPAFDALAEGARGEALILTEEGRWVEPRHALLRLVAEGGDDGDDGDDGDGGDGEEGLVVEGGGVGGSVVASEALISCAWLRQAADLSFIAPSMLSRLGVVEARRLGVRRFTVDVLLRCLAHWQRTTGATDRSPETLLGSVAPGGEGELPQWLPLLYDFLRRRLRPKHVSALRSLPLFCTAAPDGTRTLASAAAAPPLVPSVPPSLALPASRSGAVRVVSGGDGAKELLVALGGAPPDAAAVVRAVVAQHAAVQFGSPAACLAGLELVQSHWSSFLEDEASRARAAVADDDGARDAALSWAKAALCIPCTDGAARTAAEVHVSSVVGVSCPGCTLGDAAARVPPRRAVLPLRLAPPHGRHAHPKAAVVEEFDGSGGGRRETVHTLSAGGSKWCGVRCSAGCSFGRVAFTWRWLGGLASAGFGVSAASPHRLSTPRLLQRGACTGASLSPYRRPGADRFSVGFSIANGEVSLTYRGVSTAIAGVRVARGDSLTVALDADSGLLFLALGRSLIHVPVARGRPLPAPFASSEELARAAVPLPPVLCGVELFVIASLCGGEDGPAKASLRLSSPVEAPALRAAGFRPLSVALAAQRSGGRSKPLAVAPSGGDALGWERLLLALGASPHLDGCEFRSWWQLLFPEAHDGVAEEEECAVCMSALLPSKEVVRTRCGHRFHRSCLAKWLDAAEEQAPSCPVCRRPVQSHTDAAPAAGTPEAARLLSAALDASLLAACGDAEPAAMRHLCRLAASPLTCSLLGAVPVEASTGRAPLATTLLSSAFSHLGAGLAPLLHLTPSPTASALLHQLGVATRPDLEGMLQLLRAIVAATSRRRGAGCSLEPRHAHALYALYAALEAAAKADDGVERLRRVFAAAPLLWSGASRGFVASSGAACGGPEIAAALRLVDPSPALPGLGDMLLDVLRLRRLSPVDGLTALRALAEKEEKECVEERAAAVLAEVEALLNASAIDGGFVEQAAGRGVWLLAAPACGDAEAAARLVEASPSSPLLQREDDDAAAAAFASFCVFEHASLATLPALRRQLVAARLLRRARDVCAWGVPRFTGGYAVDEQLTAWARASVARAADEEEERGGAEAVRWRGLGLALSVASCDAIELPVTLSTPRPSSATRVAAVLVSPEGMAEATVRLGWGLVGATLVLSRGRTMLRALATALHALLHSPPEEEDGVRRQALAEAAALPLQAASAAAPASPPAADHHQWDQSQWSDELSQLEEAAEGGASEGASVAGLLRRLGEAARRQQASEGSAAAAMKALPPGAAFDLVEPAARAAGVEAGGCGGERGGGGGGEMDFNPLERSSFGGDGGPLVDECGATREQVGLRVRCKLYVSAQQVSGAW